MAAKIASKGYNTECCRGSLLQVIPAAGALIAPVESAAGVKPCYVGKPNPLMMRHALEVLQPKRLDTITIGDRMDTDILAGLKLEHLQHTYMPRFILNGLVPSR
eukprot:jgi/Chlat1/8958/Chrsp94S00696